MTDLLREKIDNIIWRVISDDYIGREAALHRAAKAYDVAVLPDYAAVWMALEANDTEARQAVLSKRRDAMRAALAALPAPPKESEK